MTVLIAFTQKGCALGVWLAQALDGRLYAPDRFAAAYSAASYGDLQDWIRTQFRPGNQIIFIAATGIAVRTIAPLVKDKFTDPAVVAVDEGGCFAVPLLSGHVGGANELARTVASLTQGQAVISTATDVNQLFAADEWARKNHLFLAERQTAKALSAALLEGKPVGFFSELPYEGEPPQELRGKDPCIGIYLGTDLRQAPFPTTLHLLPRDLILGIGCKRGTDAAHLERVVLRVLEETALSIHRICAVSTIDLKAEEDGLRRFCEKYGWPMECFSAVDLNKAEGEFTPSAFVSAVTGTDNVCERAAVCAGGHLIVKKCAIQGVTIAVAQRPLTIRF